jgi:metallophosphoesterase superfamily enzyme
MRLEFIEKDPALIVENRERTLVIADLHFGIEYDLALHGWHFRSRSAERLERMLEIVRETAPDRLILLGDVKHGVPITSRQEYRELPEILSAVRALVPLCIFPGNHDAGLERLIAPVELMPAAGAVIDGVGYLHGHTYPSAGLAGRLLIAGHHHPLVALHDEVGCALRAPAYLLAPVNEACLGLAPANPDPETGLNSTRVLFIPAFNELSGFDVIRIWKSPISPLSRCMEGERAEVFLADGTCVGSLPLLEEGTHDR